MIELLKQDNKVLYTLLDGIDEAVLIFEKLEANTHKIIFVNEYFIQLFGYAEDDMVGKSLDFLIQKEHLGDEDAFIFASVEKQTPWIGTATINGKNSLVSKMKLNYMPLTVSNGLSLYGALFFKDKKVCTEVDKLQKENSYSNSFFANVSHELRTPLNAVINFSEDILEDFDEIATNEEVRSESKRMLQKVIKNAKNLLSIVNDLLDISKLRIKNNHLQLDSVSLKPVLAEVYEGFKDSVHSGVNTEMHLCAEDVIVETNSKYLKQVLVNLLSNAIKFTDVGKIVLSLKRLDGFAIIEVMDSGRGIAKEKMDIIFDPFIQVDSFGEGAGLGLRLVREICAKLNIELHIESELGVGTLFYLKLNID